MKKYKSTPQLVHSLVFHNTVIYLGQRAKHGQMLNHLLQGVWGKDPSLLEQITLKLLDWLLILSAKRILDC